MVPTRNTAPPENPYVLDPRDHPQAARPVARVPEPTPPGMVLGPRDANGGYMVSERFK